MTSVQRGWMIIAAGLVAAAAGLTGPSAGAQPPRTATPTPTRTPTPTPPPTWPVVGMAGGPIYGLDVYAVRAGRNPVNARQQVVAAGNTVWTGGQGIEWSPRSGTGPVDNVRAATDGVIFADNTAGRAWRSTTYGDTWITVRVRDDAPAHFLAVSPFFGRDSVALAVTTDDWRPYRFDKSSTAWVEVVIKPGERHAVGAAGFSPLFEADETVLLGTDKGIFRSTNGGQTWALFADAADGAPTFGPAAGPIERQGIVFPDDYGDDAAVRWDLVDHTVFAFNTSGAYRSDDDGATWRRLPLNAEAVYDLAVSNAWPADPVLVAAIRQPGAVAAVSDDGGATWRMVAGPAGVSGTGAAVARDFGAPGYRVPPIPGFDHVLRMPILAKNALDRTPAAPGYRGSREAYIATDADGVWRSQDGGATWDRETSRATLRNIQPTSLVALPGGAPEALAGTEAAGLYRSTDGGRSWAWLDTELPRGHGQDIHRLVVSPAYAADRTVFAATTSGVWAGREGGRRWTKLAGPAPARALAVSPAFARDRTLVADGQISTDGGATWQPLPVVGAFPWHAAVFSARFETDRTLWVSRVPQPDETLEFTLYRSQDAGQTWQRVDVPSIRARQFFDLSTLSVGADPLKLIAASDSGLYVTQDYGATWTRPNGTPGRRSVALASLTLSEPHTIGVVAVAADDGLYWSVNRGVSWSRTPQRIAGVRAIAWAPDGMALFGVVPMGVTVSDISLTGLAAAEPGAPARR